MALLDWLRALTEKADAGAGDTDTVRRIVRELDRLEPARARFLAAFAYVLSRVAGADSHFTDDETSKMVELVARAGRLTDAPALVVVEIAKRQNTLFGGTENFLVTREFRELATEDERREMLDCLFAVSAADGIVTLDEESQIWQTASELGFTHDEYIAVRLKYSSKRSVLRPPE
jgi:uncharacterized tellurite resistance protein B-like protein